MSDKRMNDSDDSFEKKWKDAFKDASVNPSDKVWAGIDNALGPQKYRITPFYYRLAAVLILLLISTGVFYTFFNSSDDANLADTASKEFKNLPNPSELSQAELLQTIDSFYNDASLLRSKKFSIVKRGNLEKALEPLIEAARATGYTLNDKSLITLYKELDYIPTLYKWTYPNAEGKYKKLPYSVRKKRKKKHKPEFFVRLNASSSFYEPNFRLKRASDYSRNYNFYDDVYSRRPETSTMNLVPIPDVFNETLSLQRENSSFSYSAGLGFGAKFFKHWIIQGGVNYNMFRTIASSNLTVSDIERTIEYPLIINTSPEEITQVPTINSVDIYNVQNSFEYISIPIETGIQFNVRKHSLLLKTGVSTDIFLRNTIADTEGRFSTLSVSITDNFSPYRKLNWSGNIGAEFSIYQNNRYSLLFEGNYRMAFTNVTNGNSTFTSKPQYASVGLVFRFAPKRRF